MRIKASPGMQKYMPLGGHSTTHDQTSSSSRAPHSPPEYELRERKFSFSDRDGHEGFQQKQSTGYAQVTSSELPDAPSSSSSPPPPFDTASTGRVNTGFNPLFTRKWILLCFAILWILIFVSLQIIYSVSEKQRGLATTRDDLWFIWTYGPTALLVIITVQWRQVDYAAKYIQPWAALAKGPLPAHQTLLLDYITDFQVVALWQAIRLRHATIASTITIFIMVKASTVISTALFISQPTAFPGLTQSMRITTVFDSSTGLPMDKIDSRPAVALYGHAEYKMLLPNGTTEQYAYQRFEPTNALTSTVLAYNASVDVFVADGWDCQTGLLTNETSFRDPNPDFGMEITPIASYYNTTIKLPGCEIYNGHLDAPSWFYTENDTDSRYGYWATFQRVNCSNLDPSDINFKRYLISAAYSKGVGQNDNIMLNSSNVVCRPSYKVQPAYVTVSATEGVNDNNIQFHGTPRQLDGVTADDVALAVWSSLKQTTVPPDISTEEVVTDQFVQNMIRMTPNFRPDMLMNNTWLSEYARQVYQQTSAQVAALYLLNADETGALVQGTTTRQDRRLWVREIPVRIMQALALIMLVLTGVMLFTIPQNVVPRPIESVAAIAVILARSPSLTMLLKNTGHLDLQELKSALSGYLFASKVSDTPHGKIFSISVTAGSGTTAPPATTKHIKWTRPLVLQRLVMILTLSFAIAVLITLEVLYRQAQSKGGLSDVSDQTLQRYAWLYAPTVILVLLATTFNLLDFELEFSDPYHELARGSANASSSLLWDPLRNITLQTFFRALKHTRFALVASSISVILAPFLTIIASGLFEPLNVPATQPITVQTQSWFNLTSSDDYAVTGLSSSFPLPALILQGNMSYPQWTYDEVAFPSFNPSLDALGKTNTINGTLLLSTPAIRASMTCTRLQESDFFSPLLYDPACTGSFCLAYNISTPNGCGNTGYIGQEYLSYQGNIDAPVGGTGYFGSLQTGPGQVTSQLTNETINCPQWLTIYGRIENAQVTESKAFWCNSGFEIVQTKANFEIKSQAITSIVSVNESSASVFNSDWQPESSTGSGGPYFIPVNLTHADEGFDDFVTAMVYGKDGVPRDQLLANPSGTDSANDPYTTQLIHTYRQWTAQWASIHMRDTLANLNANTTNIAGGTLPSTLPAVYSDLTRQRLFLSAVSTRILEAVIASLVICGIIIFILVDMSHVLPKKVGTIGAVASLFAGSRFVAEGGGLVPIGTEWLSDGEIGRRGLWRGEKFRMGWWDGEGEGTFARRRSDAYDRGSVDVTGRDDTSDEKKEYFGIDVVPRAVE